jgi:hypothetical protein
VPIPTSAWGIAATEGVRGVPRHLVPRRGAPCPVAWARHAVPLPAPDAWPTELSGRARASAAGTVFAGPDAETPWPGAAGLIGSLDVRETISLVANVTVAVCSHHRIGSQPMPSWS